MPFNVSDEDIAEYEGSTSTSTTTTLSHLSSATETPMKPKKVHFGSVRMYTHANILGDNPSVSRGLPITVGWKAVSFELYDSVDEFEWDQLHHRSVMDDGLCGPQRISAYDRERIVRESGHSRSSLKRVHREIDDIQRTSEVQRIINKSSSRRSFWNRLRFRSSNSKQQRCYR